jgi:hypothetical protein
MNIFLLKKQVLIFLFLLKILDLYSQPFVEQTGISLPGVSNSSVAWGDYDNDGDLDILLTGSMGISRIYRNDGNNTFTWQESIDLTDIRQGTAVWGDYDNDGDLDILMSGYEYGRCLSRIHRNNGDNTFTCQNAILLTDVYNGSAAWGDYDNDGDLDILLTGMNYSYQNVSKIFRNNGDNSFIEQTSISLTGVNNSSVAWGDYDNDGKLDILLTGSGVAKIYRNSGNNIFSEQTGISLKGVNYSSVTWGDYDNDGDLDILLTGSGISKIYRNNGDNSFTEQTGIALTGVTSGAVAWGDYDNDGDLDLLLTGSGISRIYRNNDNNSFSEQTDIALPGVTSGSVAWGDYDNDGDLDIILTGYGISKIYRNELNTLNVKASMPSNLQAVINNGTVTFTWDKASDTETPQNGLSYNLYVYENGQINYEYPPHAFRQSDAKNGKRLVAKIGNIQWSTTGYTLKNLLPDKTYYWSVQAVDAGLQGGSFSTEQTFTIPLYGPYTQADCITLSNVQTTQASVSWKNGGGTKRAVFIKATSTGTADPVDNTTYLINSITPGGWKCVYYGTASSFTLSGLAVNTNYLLHVCEYNGAAGSEKYLKSSAYQNPALLSTIFTEQITLTAVNSGSAAWGDYDKDGDLDILLTGSLLLLPNYNPVSKIYLNNGNNTFTEQASILLEGVYHSSVAWGDYDNDGDLDILLTGDNGTSPVSKIYRNNGNNTFTEQTNIVLTGVKNSSVSWGDYDNDGDLDILLTGLSGSGYVSEIYRNNGDNSFTKQTNIALTGVFNSSVAFGDYDNDGDLDILLSGATGDYPNYNPVSKVYRNNGNNNFIELTGISFSSVYNSSLAWGDYDNDRDLDILLTGQDKYNQYISKIYRNNGNDNFTEQTDISIQGVNNSASTWGDYDNDGDLDILLSGYNGSKYISLIYLNNGGNTFTSQTGIALTGVFCSSVAWGDYENDGDLDILLTGSTGLTSVSKIFRNEISITNVKPSVPAGLQSNWSNDTIIFKWNRSSDNSTPEQALNYNIRIGITAGGNQIRSAQALSTTGKLLLPNITNIVNDTCVKFKLPFNKYYWSVQAVDKGDMSSSFATEQTTPLDSIQAKDMQGFVKSGNSLLIRWKNGNGLRRALFGRLSSMSGSAIPEDGITYRAEPYFGLGDKIGVTGWYCMYDGKADSAIIYGIDRGQGYDIQVVEYIEVNDLPVYFNTIGSGNPGIFSTSLFTEQTGIVLSAVAYESPAWGDYDNDGDLDILLTGESSSLISKIYRNNGNNTFSEQTGIPLSGVRNGSSTWGDYDNDGDLDILITGNTPIISKVYRNNGNNSFTEQTSIVLTGVHMSSVAWGDYDNDNDIDILLTGADEGMPDFDPVSKIYRNNSNNSFAEQTQITLSGVQNSAVAWSDYDNDGDLDILLTGSGISRVYRNNGDNTFTIQTGIALTGISYSSVAWGDYDNDGDLDILLRNKVYRNNGNNTFTEQVGIVLTGFSSGYGSWGDYDNDGDLDISFSGYCDGSGDICKIFRNEGNNTFSEQISIKLPSKYYNSPALWGDYDNDGDLDILLGYKVYSNNTFMKAGNYPANKKPSAPGNLLATAQPGGTMLSWSPVKTDETSYKAMTYNVRISNTIMGSDVCTPQADSASGYRRIVAMGNAQLDTTFLIKNLSSSKFYWSVQAVDQGYKGGDWAAVDSFIVKNTQAFFNTDIVCQGLPTHFTDQSIASDGNASWKWDFKDGSFSSLQNPVHTYSASGTYLVKLLITSTKGDKDSLEQNVIVKARPLTSFTAPDVCEGTTTAFTNTTNVNGLTISSWRWNFGDNTPILTIQNPGNHTYSLKGTYHTKLIAVATNGCSDSTMKDVVVATIPNAAVSVNGKTTFCQGDSVQLIVEDNPLYTYQWKLDNNNLINTNTNSYKVKLNSGAYSVKITNTQANCVATSSQTNVTVNLTPVSPYISAGGPVQFCQDDSIVLSVTNTAGYTYQWKLNAGAIGSDSNQFVARNSGTYNLIVSNANGCSVASTNSIDITVNSVPSVSNISFSGQSTFCQGSSVILSVPSATGYTYNWRNEYGLISGANTNSYTASISGKYQLDISNSSGCIVRTSSVSVTVKPSPYKPVLESVNYESGKCPGENAIRLFATQNVAEYKYQWYKDGFPLINKTLSNLELFEQGIYKLETSLADCKSESYIFNIIFPNAPEKPMIYVQGPTVWYLACSNSKASKYKWYCNDKLIEGADKYYYVANRRMGDYQVSIANELGCYTRSDVVTIPTGATGINDIDPFEGLKIYPNPTTGMFTIGMDNEIFGELLITIITEQGNEIRSIKSIKTTEHFFTQIDLSTQSKGLYFINLAIEKYFVTKKVVVE